jgi:chitodextrinase
MNASTRRRLVTIATAGLLVAGGAAATVITALPAAAATICEQFGSVTAGDYRIMNNRWGTSATQCINTTANGFSIIQQDGIGNFSGAPTAYPAIYLGCHYSSCSPSAALPRQINTISSAPNSITLSYPTSGSWNAAYDIWLNVDNNTTGVQDTEIMIWLNRNTQAGNIQPIGGAVGTVTIAGRSWQVWTGNNGQNNVVSYLFQGSPLTSFNFDAMGFINDTFSRGSQYGTPSWWLTSVQAGFEPWVGGVGLTINSFSSAVNTGQQQQPPGAPSNLAVQQVQGTSVVLTWTASTGTVTNYQVERCQGATCTTFAPIGTTTFTSFSDTNLASNTTYRYRVRATNSAGNSPYSNIVNATTGTAIACVPTGFMVTGTTSSSISLGWQIPQPTCNTAAFELFRAPGASGGTFTLLATINAPGTSYTDGGLSANTTFRYQLRARNTAGNLSGFTGVVTATTQGTTQQPPGTPGQLSVTTTTASTVSLTWGASTGTVSSYLIERCTGATCTNFVQVLTSTATSATDGGLAANTTYRYRVRASNSAGNSGYSNTANGTTTGGGGGGGCSATMTLQTQWPNGYVMQPITVTNTGTSTINGWTVTFTLPAGHTITNSWNATVTISGQTVTARGISGQNASLGAGASTTWGFQASRPSGNTALPSGATCTSP